MFPTTIFSYDSKNAVGAFKSVIALIYLMRDFTLLYTARLAFSEFYIRRLFLKGYYFFYNAQQMRKKKIIIIISNNLCTFM